MQASADEVAFGPFRMVVSRRTLERDGTFVPLSSRGFDILQFLMEARDRVVSRDEIMARVWPGLAVEGSNLTVQISNLRRALGDAGPEAQVIATVPGRGYRFVGRIDESDVPPAPMDAGADADERTTLPHVLRVPRDILIGAACLAALGVFLAAVLPHLHGPKGADDRPPLSLVVMPLRDLSDRPGQTYLADAVSDDLTTALAQLPGSTVIARETADSYKGRAVAATQVGRELHVRYLLEGSLRAEERVLHVNDQLIDTVSGGHVWAQAFDVPRDAPGEARDAIVRRIAASLDVELVEAESARALRDRPHDPTALDLFFQARSILDHDDSLAGFRGAQSLLERAVALRPDFTDALAELAAALVRKTLSVDDPDADADTARARAVTARALALSPHNPVALADRAQLLYLDGHTDEATYAARDALAAEPANLGALAVLGHCAWDRGRLDEAAGAFQTILRLNPNAASNKPRLLMLGNIRLVQGRIDEAVDLTQRATAGDPPPAPGVDSWGRAEGAATTLLAARVLGGRLNEAQALYVRFAQLWPHRTVWRIGAEATKAVARLPGFTKFLGALGQAGMPLHADERVDDHVPPSTTPLPEDKFLPTPREVPGAVTVDTDRLAAIRRNSGPMAIIDLGGGAAVMSGAVVRGPAEQDIDDSSFADSALRRAGADLDTPVVVLADGTYGSRSYNAALRLTSRSYHHVLWYRGGEEAWAAAGEAAEDRRE